MKKTLIAAAVLAASGAAMAQSSVQIYGIADVWVGSEKDGLTASSVTKVGAGGISSSRLGFTGTEDLGGGLSAKFTMELGVDMVDGTGLGDSRTTTVGFAGGFGEVALGFGATVYDDYAGSAFANFDSSFTPEYAVFSSADYTSRRGQQIKYISPEFAGFTGAFSYSLDGNPATNEKISAVALSYSAGPLYAVLAAQNEENTTFDEDFIRLGASYDLGVAVLKANYGNFDSGTGAKSNEYSIGADFPVTDVLTLSAGYARSKFNAAGNDVKNTGYGISGMYALSKRTSLYAGVVSATEKNAAGVKTDKYRLYAAGVKHTF